MAESGNSSNAGRVAFTYPDFSLYQLARFLIVAGLEMQSVAVGWQIYEITKRPLDLGLVGLAQFSPGILLFLVTGHAADTLQPAKTADDLLRGIWRVLGAAALLRLERNAHGVAHVRHRGSAWRGAVVQQPGEPLALAADHPRRTFAERHRLEQFREPGRDDSGPVARRLDLRRRQRALRRSTRPRCWPRRGRFSSWRKSSSISRRGPGSRSA